MSDAPLPGARRRRPWIVIPAVLVLIGLGTWQMQRLAWKTALLDDIAQRMAAPPLAFAELYPTTDLATLDFRPVILRGQYRHTDEFFLVARTHKGRPGQHLITPLAAANGELVLVNRGWIPDALRDPARRPETRMAGPVTVTGVLRLPHPGGWMTPDNEPQNNVWFTIDPAAMGTVMAQGDSARGPIPSPAPVILHATAETPASALPIPAPVVVNIRNNHLGYAITWYALALALAVIGAMVWRQSGRDGT